MQFLPLHPLQVVGVEAVATRTVATRVTVVASPGHTPGDRGIGWARQLTNCQIGRDVNNLVCVPS